MVSVRDAVGGAHHQRGQLPASGPNKLAEVGRRNEDEIVGAPEPEQPGNAERSLQHADDTVLAPRDTNAVTDRLVGAEQARGGRSAEQSDIRALHLIDRREHASVLDLDVGGLEKLRSDALEGQRPRRSFCPDTRPTPIAPGRSSTPSSPRAGSHEWRGRPLR